MEKQTVGDSAVSEYLLTYLWVGMEILEAVLLYDAFSERKWRKGRFWGISAGIAFLDATALNLFAAIQTGAAKMIWAIAFFFLLHTVLYHSSRIFGLYIAMIAYGMMCCISNLGVTFLLLRGGTAGTEAVVSPAACFALYCMGIAVCWLHRQLRTRRAAGTAHWKWYTVPALLSLAGGGLICFFEMSFRSGEISAGPLFAVAGVIAVIQIGALFLVGWLEQDSRVREETFSLKTKAQAQQESIEALSAAYAQQRKLTHDFRAHLDTLDGLLAQKPMDIRAVQQYLGGLRAAQTSRIMLVNTHHAALDALLNQKAFAARNRNIDIQFAVNDLSAVVIDMVDLTVLISNTLDNAMEACEKLPASERQIFVKVLLEEDVLFYSVRNRSLPVRVEEGRLPPSTKKDSSLHGYGLQNVQTILKKYHSLYAMSWAEGWFDFATDLPNIRTP